MVSVTKTLEVRLVHPTANKERKLRETTNAYREALHEAFEADCTTKSAANDVMVDYDLSGYAKNALKQYVLQLCGDSYDADDRIEIGHPETEGLVIRRPCVCNFVGAVVVVLDVEDTGRLITRLFSNPVEHLRLKCVEGRTGEKLTAISHAIEGVIERLPHQRAG